MSLLHSESTSSVPEQLIYSAGLHSNDVITRKKTLQIMPEQQGPYRPGNVLKFKIKNPMYMQGSSVTLHFQAEPQFFYGNTQASMAGLTYVSGGARTPQFDDGMHCVIKTGTLSINGKRQVERVDNHNAVHGLISKYTVPQEYKNSWGDNEGYWIRNADDNVTYNHTDDSYDWKPNPYNTAVCSNWDVANGAAASAVQTEAGPAFVAAGNYGPTDNVNSRPFYRNNAARFYRRGKGYNWYSLKLDMFGLLQQSKALYIPTLGSVDIELLLELGNKAVHVPLANTYPGIPSADLVTNGADPNRFLNAAKSDASVSYDISNAYLTADFIETAPSYTAALRQALNTTGLTYDFKTWSIFQPTVAKGTTGSVDYIVNQKLSSVDSIICFFKPNEFKTAGAIDHDITFPNKTAWTPRNEVASYQMLIDMEPVVPHIVHTVAGQSSEAISELAKALGLGSNSDFMADCTVEKYLNTDVTCNDDPCFAIGSKLKKGALISGKNMDQLVVRLQYANPTAVNASLVIAVLHDKRLIVQAGHNFIQQD